MSFLISNAEAASSIAASAPQMGQPDSTFSLVMIVAIFILFYFMLIRPQNKRAKEHRDLVSQLKVGDEIITTGGLLGKVVTVNDQFIKLNLADNLDIQLQRNAVTAVLPKGTMKTLK